MKYKKYFLAFSDSGMWRTLNRIKKQATALNIYDAVYTCTEKDLSTNFKEYFKDKLKSNVRGFGYWCWKPQIILQVLEQMREGDILQYTDAGCQLNKKGLPLLREYFTQTAKAQSGIVAFQLRPEDGHYWADFEPLLEKYWTKGDLFDYFSARDRTDVRDTEQVCATAIFIKKQATSLSYIKEWRQVFYTNFNLVDDSSSLSPNFVGFREHRGDQSVFSILAKTKNFTIISCFDLWGAPHKYPHTSQLPALPILAARDKDYGFLKNTLIKIKNISRRLKVNWK
jgi:hypothetical protein